MGRHAGTHTENEIRALNSVQNTAAKFAHHSGGSNWESLARHRKIAHLCVLYKAHTGERAWKEIGDRLRVPSYLSRVDHKWKIRARRQETDVGKYCFVHRTTADWNQLPEEVIKDSHSKLQIFRKRIMKILTSEWK